MALRGAHDGYHVCMPQGLVRTAGVACTSFLLGLIRTAGIVPVAYLDDSGNGVSKKKKRMG